MPFWIKLLSIALLLSSFRGSTAQESVTETKTIHVQVLDANTGRPILKQNVYVDFKGRKDIPAFPVDANGIATITVKSDDQIWTTTYWDACGGRPLLGTNHDFVSVERILAEGVVFPNPCGRAKTTAVKGTIIVFGTKPTFWQNFVRGLQS